MIVSLVVLVFSLVFVGIALATRAPTLRRFLGHQARSLRAAATATVCFAAATVVLSGCTAAQAQSYLSKFGTLAGALCVGSDPWKVCLNKCSLAMGESEAVPAPSASASAPPPTATAKPIASVSLGASDAKRRLR